MGKIGWEINLEYILKYKQSQNNMSQNSTNKKVANQREENEEDRQAVKEEKKAE
jgi:hypothetical protein